MYALALVAIVAAMSVTPPGRHETPTWPFGFRLSADALGAGSALRVLAGSQIAVLGVVALLTAPLLRAWWPPLSAGAAVLIVGGAALALPPLALDAHPTTYLRPAVPYQASSIVSGQTLYAAHCVACHGLDDAGDAPAVPRPARPSRDLRAPRAARHTAADQFWWITHGIPRAGMPAFGAEVITADTRGGPETTRRLGAEPRILSPVVTDGTGEILSAYQLIAGPPPAEVPIDRQGHVRAVARGGARAGGGPDALLAEIRRLNEEKAPPLAVEEHAH